MSVCLNKGDIIPNYHYNVALKAQEFTNRNMMQTLHILENIKNEPMALTIGNFDGVHIGHQAMLDRLVKTAKTQHLQPAAMTFSPHARALFSNCDNYLISGDEEKAQIIQQHHIQQLYQIPFDCRFANTSAEAFLNQLTQKMHVKHLLVGADFRFGNKGIGNWSYLKNYCQQVKITVEQMPTIDFHGERVSSSRIRNHILTAKNHIDFRYIAKLLGRPLSYSGIVISGDQLGRTIDFPTANIRLPKMRLLPAGVFAVAVQINNDNNRHFGMCNIGIKPTINSEAIRQIEVHLFDFNQDLYGKKLCIEPLAKIRNEQKFNAFSELIHQLHQDKKDSLSIIQSLKQP